ncbi:MAG: tRNA (adenosine(37)-N6)-threonylcarbamoyltransferase complex transferase subunit TsaD [Acutalibacteraceae bacterium]|nr:tRNA (adenosine(37)-N6)-threonylcarbamoyltransferase complex transferase subunit TsaD [Acutalibacteraceae bacterium]
MKILAIESSCDETAAAVVEDGRKVLSNVVASQVPEHKIYGGVVPEIASRRHAEAISGVVNKALSDAEVTLDDVDAVAVTYAPGLIGALLVGVNYAKGLSYGKKLPLVPVHHLRSHIAANYITHPDLKPPFFCLVVSGGNTMMVEVKDYTDFRVVGRTRDDAAGEALDKAARTMGIPYPGGLNMDKMAADGDSTAFKFPMPKVENCPYDFSFSGLKTSVINTIHNSEQKGIEVNKKDLGASFMKAVSNCLCKNTEKAMVDFNHNTLVIAGGVSANSVLRKDITELCKKHKWKLYLPELSLCGDNAAMVGSQGYYEYLSGNTADLDLNAYAGMSIE